MDESNHSSITSQDLVSIIVPVHNRTGYLQQCLNSIAQQTYPFIEVIVVDDASTEDLKGVLNKINWPETFTIKFIRLNINSGQGYAREIGRKSAKGVYINYQDSDDIFHHEKISKQVNMLKKNPQTGMCYCIALSFTNFPFDGDEKLRGSRYIESILPGILKSRPWATGSCLWTKDATDIIGPWYEARAHEDFLYDVRAGCKGVHISYVPEILIYVRDHYEDVALRKPSKEKYQKVVNTYLQVINELNDYNKLSSPKILVPVSREIFRICKKLYEYKDFETPLILVNHLFKKGKFDGALLNWYKLNFILIILMNFVIPKKYRALFSKEICRIALVIG